KCSNRYTHLPISLYTFYFSTCSTSSLFFFFLFNDTATTEIYTLSLHDALPICAPCVRARAPRARAGSARRRRPARGPCGSRGQRSEEHTSELQSRGHLVCRLLLEKKKSPRNTTWPSGWRISPKNRTSRRACPTP